MSKNCRATSLEVGETDRHYAPEIKAIDIVYEQQPKYADGSNSIFRVSFKPKEKQLVKILEILANV